MSWKEFPLASTIEMDRRWDQANEFYQAVLDPEEEPWFVSDQATLYDISTSDVAELTEKCKKHYGVELRLEHFSIPVWQLLDYLQKRRHN